MRLDDAVDGKIIHKGEAALLLIPVNKLNLISAPLDKKQSHPLYQDLSFRDLRWLKWCRIFSINCILVLEAPPFEQTRLASHRPPLTRCLHLEALGVHHSSLSISLGWPKLRVWDWKKPLIDGVVSQNKPAPHNNVCRKNKSKNQSTENTNCLGFRNVFFKSWGSKSLASSSSISSGDGSLWNDMSGARTKDNPLARVSEESVWLAKLMFVSFSQNC